MAPTQARQIVQHRLGQIARVFICRHADRAATLRQLQPVVAEDDRHVAEQRQRCAERVEDVDLPRRVVDMLVAAENVAHVHVPVIDDNAEVVGRNAVGPDDDEVVDLLVRDADRSFDKVVPGHGAVERIAKANHRIDPGRRGRQHLARLRAPAAVVAGFLAACSLRLAHLFEFLRCAVAAVGRAGVQHVVDDASIAIQPLHLVDRPFVAIEAQPLHRRENLLHRILRRPRDIGVLDSQDEVAAEVAGKRPREQRRSRRSQMKKAGR